MTTSDSKDAFDEAEFDPMFLDGGANSSLPPSPARNPVPHSMSPPLSPLSVGCIDNPSTPLATLTPVAFSPSKQSGFTAMNAVHMELQENARLPTFNMNVDRSNATSGTAVDNPGVGLRIRTSGSGGWGRGARTAVGGGEMSPSTASDINEMLRLSENDLNLTEQFLGEGSRSSAAAAYSNAGALLSSIGTRIGDKVAPSARAALAGSTRALPVGRGIAHAVSASRPSASETQGSPPDEQDLYNIYPYGRPVPLPIPSASKKKVGSDISDESKIGTIEGPVTNGHADTSPEKERGIADAIATAAAIASSQRSAKAAAKAEAAAAGGQASTNHLMAEEGTRRVPDSVSSSNHQICASAPSLVSSAAADDEKFKTPQPGDAAESIPVSSSALPDAPSSMGGGRTAAHSYPYTHSCHPYHAALAAAHSSTSASKTEATRKRSAFGFGSKHVVPSVPQPPPKKEVVQRKRPAPPESDGNGCAANSGPAYERKKQRAKDARVKLNDSIDRLSIAIGVAGTQSRQRMVRLRSIENGSQSYPSSPGPARTFRPATMKGMEDLAAVAAAAKKWDRPSFVGTAATLVQGLNLQCEALMGEIVELNRVHREEVAHLRGFNVSMGNDGSPSNLDAVAIATLANEGKPMLPHPAIRHPQR